MTKILLYREIYRNCGGITGVCGLNVTDLPYWAGVIEVGSNMSCCCLARGISRWSTGARVGLGGLGRDPGAALLTCSIALYSYPAATHMKWSMLRSINMPRVMRNKSNLPLLRFLGSHPYPLGSRYDVIAWMPKTRAPDR